MKRLLSLVLVISALAVLPSNKTLAAEQLGPDESYFPEAGFVLPDGKFSHPPEADKHIEPDFGNLTTTWGGQIAFDYQYKTNFLSVSADFTMPTSIKCNSSLDIFAPWVGLNGWRPIPGQTSATVEQTGIAISCTQPTFQVWYEMYPLDPVYISTSAYPVSAGDQIHAWVTMTAPGVYSLNIQNYGHAGQPKNWHWSTTQTNNTATRAVSAEVAVESPRGKYPNFGTLTFSSLGGNSTPGPSDSVFYTGPGTPYVFATNASSGGITQVTSSGISYNQIISPLFISTYVHE